MPSASSDSDRRLDQRLPAEMAGLRRFLGRLCGRSDLVDDLLQDTLTRSLSYQGSFRPDAELGPWLRRIALRCYLDQRRDPMDAAEVQGYLLEHPEALDEFALMRTRVLAIRPAKTPRHRRMRVAAATAAVLFVIGLVFTWPTGPVPNYIVNQSARILSYQIRVEHSYPDRLRIVRIEGRMGLRREVRIERWQFTPSSLQPGLAKIHSFHATKTIQ